MAGPHDEPDFDALMREEGARRLPSDRLRPTRASPGGPSRALPPDPAPVQAPPPGPDPRVAELEAELLAVKAQALEARLTAAEALGVAIEAGEARVAELERALALERRRPLAPAPAPAAARPETPAPVPRAQLAAVLTARGLVTPEERAAGLARVLATESGRALIDKLESRDGAGVASILERRLALLCGSPACVPPDNAGVLEVPPERCEVCGGSDIQRAARIFVAACEAAGIGRVRFVGGSPSYRTQIEALFPREGSVAVRVTEGGKRVPLSRSRAQQRGTDLVVIWGATELDHATSDAYRAEFGRVMTVANRGIGRMLELAAARIRAEA